jgi:hypothetical protein
MVGRAFGALGRDIQQAVVVGKAREAIQSISVAASAALGIVEARGSGDARLSAALARLQEFWGGHRQKLLAGLLKLAELPQPADIRQVQKAVSVVRQALETARSLMLDELSREGENAPHAANYTRSVMTQARARFEEGVGKIDYAQALPS